MSKIVLPPLREGSLAVFIPDKPRTFNSDDLRARDLEVAKCVLEAAAREASSFASVTYNSWHIAEAIRALEASHE